jgi:sodium-independent sulfate anion transporter 11
LTLFSWIHLRGTPVANYDISILKTIPSGFTKMGVPQSINSNLLGLLAPQIPVSVIILLLEHIAIAKSKPSSIRNVFLNRSNRVLTLGFGRINNYKIDPNQELIAIGISNLVGTFFNAYPATGSFSRTAIKAKAGVRTP